VTIKLNWIYINPPTVGLKVF